jgi:hypothetical protein
VRLAAGGLAAAVIAVALAACGGSQDTTHRHLVTYLAAVDRIERQLATPLNAVDTVDRQLTAASGPRRGGSATTASTPPPTVAEQVRRMDEAARQIRTVTARLRALPAPAAAAHLKAMLVQLTGRQGELAVQTQRLITFIPNFSRSLRPLGPAVVALERVLSVNRASGAAAVQQVYAHKVVALRTFVGTLQTILASLGRVRPPTSSQPTYETERRSLTRMATAATTLAGDLAGGHTSGIAGVLSAFDRAAALPGSRPSQEAERAAIRAYDRQVGQLGALAADANRERLRLARVYP